jgi:hypothetical protein
MTLAPVSSLGSGFAGLYIQGKTKVKATLSATGKYSSTIKSYKMIADGATYDSSDSYTSDYLGHAGSIAVTGYATDSRDITGSKATTITVIPYSKPQILPVSGESEVVAARCDSSGNLSDSGTYLKIKAKRIYSKVMSTNGQYNYCKIRYRYKAERGSYSSWTNILLGSNLTTDEITTGALLGGALAVDTSYIVQVQAIDDIGEYATTTISVPTDKVFLHKAGSINSLGIGKYAEEENMVDVAEEITTKFRGKVQFAGEEWISLGLSENVTEPSSLFGRWGGSGCYYRVCAGEKHVYVAFNCGFTYSGSAIIVSANAIPEGFRPKRNIYAQCPVGGRSTARVIVTKNGEIAVDWVQAIASAEATTSATVKWIDGYIDYWV